MIIDLGKRFAPILGPRGLVKVLEEENNGEKIILDFRNVEFVSRSFAYELLKYKQRNPSVEFINISPSVARMFEIVEHQIGEVKSSLILR